MFFSIFIYFPDTKPFNLESFKVTWTSVMTQLMIRADVYVIGTTAQIQAVEANFGSSTTVGKIEFISGKAAIGQLLNQTLQKVQQNWDEKRVNSKLILLRAGDYINSDFCSKSKAFLDSLNLFREPITKFIPYGSFLYNSSQQKIYTANQTLGQKLETNSFWNVTQNPKFLAPSIQYFWDLHLVLKYNLQFDPVINDFNLQLSKFSLDYFLLVARLNDFVEPKLIYSPDLVYISKLPFLPSVLALEESNTTWKDILRVKYEDFRRIAGWRWFWYRFQLEKLGY